MKERIITIEDAQDKAKSVLKIKAAKVDFPWFCRICKGSVASVNTGRKEIQKLRFWTLCSH